ncbi:MULTISPECIES: HAD-IA family hydrolase [unclassified Streptomyces]|uniref:HAD-IA family hydrolase n=1 Tax=unclassified Streptomyces TaxID=2593676 RepID=UPI00081DC7C0|nr:MULTISPECIES: HAD-IA family hydrolase [unclassified Streptomyces]MYR28296.1 HAD-IA family hydrolase [Streptomyces sp. SID4945]SCF36304.1 sugar-phosphatase [Streptomyces sp. LcepLS]
MRDAPPVRAVLLDVDGVLLDSAASHRRVWDTWALRNGLDPEAVWPLTFGRRPEDTVRAAAPALDAAAERRAPDALLAAEGDAVPPVPGAGGLLAALEAARVPWALVTSGGRAAVPARFAAAGLPLPRVRVHGEDVVRGKPAPDCYALAAARLGVPPDACVAVEDAPAGAEAARAAGCHVIGLTIAYGADALPAAHTHAASHTEVRAALSALGVLPGPGLNPAKGPASMTG